MKDCTTFLKLQEAALNKQAEAKRRDTKEIQATHLQLNKETMGLLRVKISRTRDATTTKDMFHLKGTSQE
jgi:hypothetical protein